MVNSMSELKRLPVGTKIKLIACRRASNQYAKKWNERHNPPEPCKEPALTIQDLEQFIDVPHKALNITRTIEKMQTNAIKFSAFIHKEGDVDKESVGSWLYFPSAKFFIPVHNGFQILPDGIYDSWLIYEVE